MIIFNALFLIWNSISLFWEYLSYELMSYDSYKASLYYIYVIFLRKQMYTKLIVSFITCVIVVESENGRLHDNNVSPIFI